MSAPPRALIRLLAFGALILLCLACCITDCDDTPEESRCSDGAPTAAIDALEVRGGWERGLQGATMITASFVWRGTDVPDCARVSVRAESLATGAVLWEEETQVETEDLPSGSGRRSKGVLFRIEDPSPPFCTIRIVATSYGQTAETTSTDMGFSCGYGDAGTDAGPEDAGPVAEDAGTDAGALDEDAGGADDDAAVTADAGGDDAG